MPLRTRSILSGNPPKSVALHTIASCLAPVSSVNSTFFLTHECPLILSRPISVLSTLWLADRKSTCLNSSHSQISYAVFCLKKKEHTSELHHSQRAYAVFCLKKKMRESEQAGSDIFIAGANTSDPHPVVDAGGKRAHESVSI